MRMRLGCVALLALASLSCKTTESEPVVVMTGCPSGPKWLGDQDSIEGRRTLYDASGDGLADRWEYADHILVDRDYDGQPDLVVETRDHAVVSWEMLPRAATLSGKPSAHAPAPLELAPLDLLALIPDLQPPADAQCLARADVSAYLGELRDRAYGRWMKPPPPKGGKPASFVVRFSLASSGELTGACLQDGDKVAGSDVVRAMLRASPYDPLPPNAQCLVGRRLVGTFTGPLPTVAQ